MNFHVLNGATLNGSRVGAILAAAAILERLAALVRESVTESAKVKAVRDTLSADDVPLTGPALQAFIKRTWPTYRRLTREIGIAAD